MARVGYTFAMMNKEKIQCDVGITAHNEETNIGRLLELMLSQTLQTVIIDQIIVVISGCTDNTEAIVRHYMNQHPHIQLLVQEKREGKASAINLFLKHTEKRVVVLCSADLQPEEDAIEKLASPFADPEMGMTSSRPVPVNDPHTFMGFTAHMLWNLHHDINLHGGFKAGEMVAFLKIFERIPYSTSVDEASIEPVIRGQGYKVQYIPDAIVYNKGPDTVSDFLRQRRRIYAGHLDVKQLLGYSVSTMSGGTILKSLLRNLDWHPRSLLWTLMVVGLEIYGRLLGYRDFKNRYDHTVWEVATTTKQLKTDSPPSVSKAKSSVK